MTHLEDINEAAHAQGLAIVGAFHPGTDDLAPEGTGTLVLLGPGGPEMWAAFCASAEFGDGAAHPMDRWSRRVISRLAQGLGAEQLFPFGGPPWSPFQRWAAQGEGAVSSPVQMQATSERGLWTSYRGALAFTGRLELPVPVHTNPCEDCPAPCLTTCPVDAFADGRYDVPKCTAHVRSDRGEACRSGCLVRRSCPAGQAINLPDAQRKFHIDAFLRAQP
ncbi:MAG: ferredoxin [Paracoccaceae bacterium]